MLHNAGRMVGLMCAQAMFDNFKLHLSLHSLPQGHAERQVEHMETSILFMGAQCIILLT